MTQTIVNPRILCAGHPRPEIFMPNNDADASDAYELCGACPSRQGCLQVGIRGKHDGIWGGVLLRGGVPLQGRRHFRSNEGAERDRPPAGHMRDVRHDPLPQEHPMTLSANRLFINPKHVTSVRDGDDHFLTDRFIVWNVPLMPHKLAARVQDVPDGGMASAG